MSRTQLRGEAIQDGSVKRADLDVSTPGEAVIRKIIVGNTLFPVSTGTDSGTGDVTLETLDGMLGKTINYVSNKISSIEFFTDSAKTNLYRTFIINWSGNNINTIEIRNSSNTLLQTKTFSYDGNNNLTGVTIT